MLFFFLTQYLVDHFVILCSCCLSGVDGGDVFENERDELGEPSVCLYFPFEIGVHVCFP